MPFSFSLTFIPLQKQVAVDDNPYRETRPDRQRRLDVEIALNRSLSVWFMLSLVPRRSCNDIGIVARTGGHSKFAGDPEQFRQQRSLELSAPVIADLILKASIAGRIGSILPTRPGPGSRKWE